MLNDTSVGHTTALYCRVSTQEQADSGTSLTTQMQACRDHAASLGLTVAAGCSIEEDHTGTDLTRPGLQKLLSGAASGAFDTVIAYTLDRLYRPKEPGDEWKIFSYMDALRQHGVTVLFVDTSVPTAGPFASVMQFLRSFSAGQERAAFIERTARGKRRRASEGRMPNGVGPGVFGLTYNKADKTFTANEQQAETVRRIFRMAADRRPVRGIVRDLNADAVPTLTGALWGRTTVRRILANPIYRGDLAWGRRKRVGTIQKDVPEHEWTITRGAFPAIVTREQWDAAQNGLSVKKPSWNAGAGLYWLTGYARCGNCGAAVSGFSVRKKFRYYRCASARDSLSKVECNLRTVRAEILESEVWQQITQVLTQPDVVIGEMRAQQSQTLPVLDAELAVAESQRDGLKDREARIIRLYELGQLDDDAVAVRGRELKAERSKVKARIAALTSQITGIQQRGDSIPAIREIISRVDGTLANADNSLRRMALDALQVQVKVSGGECEVSGAVPIESMKSLQETSSL